MAAVNAASAYSLMLMPSISAAIAARAYTPSVMMIGSLVVCCLAISEFSRASV